MEQTDILATIANWLSAILLTGTIAYISLKKGWKLPYLKFILFNTLYNVLLLVIQWLLPAAHKVVYNLTMQVDLLTTFLIFYTLWNNANYRKLLLYSAVPVVTVWAITLLIYGISHLQYINLMLGTIWTIIISLVAILFLYRSNTTHEMIFARFFIAAGFLFYNFTYLIIESFYRWKHTTEYAEAWNLNLWSYVFSRAIILAGVITFSNHKKPFASNTYMVSSS